MRHFSHALLTGLIFFQQTTRADLIEIADRRQWNDPAFVSAFADQNASVRAQAVRLLGQTMKMEAIDLLIPMLRDTDLSVRNETCVALGQFGYDFDFTDVERTKVANAIRPFVAGVSLTVRAPCVEAYAKTVSPDGDQILLMLTSHPDAAIRNAALHGLYEQRIASLYQTPLTGEVHPYAPSTKAAVIALARDENEDTRFMVARILGRIGTEEGIATLVSLLGDSVAEVRIEALDALNDLTATTATDAVRAALSDSDPRVRLSAVMTLTKFQADIPAETANDSFLQVRAATAEAWSHATEAQQVILRTLLLDPSITVQLAAFKSLVTSSAFRFEDLVSQYLRDPNWQKRKAAVEMQSSVERGIELIELGLQDPDQNVSMAAYYESLTLPGEAGLQNIRAGLHDPIPDRRYYAANVLSGLEPRTEEHFALAWESYQLSANDPLYEQPRYTALQIIASDPAFTHADWMRSVVMNDGSYQISRWARAVLKARGATDLPALREETFRLSPYRDLRFTSNPSIVLHTTKGDIRFECFASDAPLHCAEMVGQVRAGMYNHQLWHRVEKNFVIQSSVPAGIPSLPYTLRPELGNPYRYQRGTVGDARWDFLDSGGGPGLFIDHMRTPHLDGLYTIWGQVTEGLDVVDRIEVGDEIVSADVLTL